LRRSAGIRTRVLLVSALVLVIALVTGGSLVIVRNQVREQAAQTLSADLTHSLATFQNIQRQRRDALLHENALLADLPSLKALMTTGDQRTIADGAVEFWRISASDLFALAGRDGRVLTVDVRGGATSPVLEKALQHLAGDPRKQYLAANGRLFDFAVRPLYFGSERNGTLLGFVISGYAVDHAFVNVISQAAAAQATFLAGGLAVSSTLDAARQKQLVRNATVQQLAQTAQLAQGRLPAVVSLGGERYLAIAADLSDEAAGPLQLVVLRSLSASEQAARAINRLVFLVGLAALLFGTGLMLALARVVTRPLEQLAAGVRAFGFGDSVHWLPANGTKEVRELNIAFARMRQEIAETNRALLESEKLATIGRMANSVSHDLRHYLAAVYANAEFLSSSHLTEAERVELFSEIRAAVLGTTELIDSLLTFSRGGPRVRMREPLLPVVERAIAMLRAHPEAAGVTIEMLRAGPVEAEARMDIKKIERALYNLLLNACQSARLGADRREVLVELTSTETMVTVIVTDSGAGVPEAIRETLFEPFVSEGKQSGTGLGLTLAHAIAEEHGGAVRLKSTRPGETVFKLTLERNMADTLGADGYSSGARTGSMEGTQV
jgi:signal transduction histidine kinase